MEVIDQSTLQMETGRTATRLHRRRRLSLTRRPINYLRWLPNFITMYNTMPTTIFITMTKFNFDWKGSEITSKARGGRKSLSFDSPPSGNDLERGRWC